MNTLPMFLASSETLQAIIDAVPTPVFVLDRDHRLVIVNDALCDLLGFRARDVLGRAPAGHLSDDQREAIWRSDDHVLETGEPDDSEMVVQDATGAPRVILIQKRRIRMPGPRQMIPYIVGTITDHTPLRESEERAKYLAGHDHLTALSNRSQLSAALVAATDSARRYGYRFAVLSIDLAGFKTVNDVHGFAVGDQMLQIVAQRLQAFAGECGTAFRMGGDEFCLILTGLDPSEAGATAEDRAVALLKAIAEPADIAGATVTVGAAIGLSVFPDDAGTPQRLRHRAESAMRRIKRRGGGGVGRDSAPTVGERPAEAWDIRADLSAGIAEDAFHLAYQPMVAAADGALHGYEALMRWHHPERGPVSPEVFIPVAEASGLILPMGAWVLETACREAATWPARTRVAVNVSPKQIVDPGFPRTVARVLAESGLDPARLELEITETTLITDTGAVMAAMQALKAIGVCIALDDFGTGWSSLAILRTFPFDRMKIDRAFVSHIETDSRSVAIVRTVVSLARALGVAVTAEGIETRGQLHALRAMGCDELQGFFIGRPAERPAAPRADFPRLLI
ncbi:EAL domain-containing protein [Zavarzinia compransoris]|uniref:putative bifunctional diguanylate cyclase/phosphodiesterase n=1 Tax=Zavarzinia marina TaxID=2911065 RepID=UPI001F1F0D67|nr:GGDEF domain-containing phosphodiesterase [Zavarzinia marina]MCF4165514.1 EAL domain-containing protein [Zavarzinia marina]